MHMVCVCLNQRWFLICMSEVTEGVTGGASYCSEGVLARLTRNQSFNEAQGQCRVAGLTTRHQSLRQDFNGLVSCISFSACYIHPTLSLYIFM